MRVDYHVHLEEGPYTSNWLKKTYQNLLLGQHSPEEKSSKQWAAKSVQKLSERMIKGAYDPIWLDIYLENAKRKGIKEVGIVDHLYRFTDCREYFEKNMLLDESPIGRLQKQWLNLVMTESMDHFAESISRNKEKWAKQGVQLKVGIEADYFEGDEEDLSALLCRHEWDFINGSVHFINGWGFDNPKTIHEFENYDVHVLYETFFRIVEKAIRSDLFDYISHLDNIKVFGYRPHTDLLMPMYKRIVKALKEMDAATEVNAGLFYRFPVKEMCPSEPFLHLLIENEIPLLLSSDAHFPEDIGAFLDENMDMLINKGVKEIATFDKRKRIMKPLSIGGSSLNILR
ncbi:histidinol phosphate phosphatase domain-containing protein [Metabacillus dongyingensis]|uniref:histidinol phosphate phosphatase domain-containing protein n=1 Tax=Metabacillus dongyingensis TaxID=2874282 RepID=UPI001CBD31F6|nr:histidinol phosphate phosphatase domain-containing protein [Metabacillus dongyingensis]UAL53554.1 histidinol phosphate phosphatase domain-containing protein [Metabacillus dongyingensis]